MIRPMEPHSQIRLRSIGSLMGTLDLFLMNPFILVRNSSRDLTVLWFHVDLTSCSHASHQFFWWFHRSVPMYLLPPSAHPFSVKRFSVTWRMGPYQIPLEFFDQWYFVYVVESLAGIWRLWESIQACPYCIRISPHRTPAGYRLLRSILHSPLHGKWGKLYGM